MVRQVDKQHQMFAHDFGCWGSGFFRRDRAVRPNFQRQFIIVVIWPTLRVFHSEIHFGYRREDRINGNDPNGLALLLILSAYT